MHERMPSISVRPSGLVRMTVNDVVKAVLLSTDDVANLMQCTRVKQPVIVFWGWQLYKVNKALPLCQCEWTKRFGTHRGCEELFETFDAIAKQPWDALRVSRKKALEVLKVHGYVVQEECEPYICGAVRVWVLFSRFGTADIAQKIAYEWGPQ